LTGNHAAAIAGNSNLGSAAVGMMALVAQAERRMK
jgi:hypothetical protein